MRFEEALKAMREGKKVRRPCYAGECIYWLDTDREDIIVEVYQYGKFSHQVIGDVLNYADIMLVDWEIVDEWSGKCLDEEQDNAR